MRTKVSLLLILFSLFLVSCDKNGVFDQYIELKPNSKWDKDTLVHFNFENKDTIQSKNLFINIRNNHQYKFNNLFLIVKMTKPNQEIMVDTLEYMMALPDGHFIGQKSSNIIENKLFYKKKYTFNQLGNYEITVGHANRELGDVDGIKQLEGITEVGFRIEKTN